MTFRRYDSAKDKLACHRIYKEVGWISEESPERTDLFFTQSGSSWVAELQGEAECLVLSAKGDLRYQDELLPFACITGVTTSRLGRRQGLAARLTARAVAAEVEEGALVAGLGMFDQGFYDKLGFGTGAYDHSMTVAPDQLKVETRARIPRRLTEDDWEAIHAARLKRRRGHGAVTLFPAMFTRGRMMSWGRNHFGLGYADDPEGGLSHLLWFSAEHVEHGPYRVKYLIYRTREQFLELMALVKQLGDQVYSIDLPEPRDVQLQDLMPEPFKHRRVRDGGSHRTGIEAHCWWQMRICDLAACLQRTHLCGEAVRFNLQLTDPIGKYLSEEQAWRGIGREYVVTLGPNSHAEAGQNPSLPTMAATVNAFTRLWLGVRPATGLATTDSLTAPEELLERLDDLMRLPQPRPDWDM